MRRHRFSSIKNRIFIPYISIILILIVLASGAYYFLSYSTFLENYILNSRQHAKIVSSQITQYLDQVNYQQKRILESEEILQYIFEQSPDASAFQEKIFYDNVYDIVGFDYPFLHMNILNLESGILTTFGKEYQTHPYETVSQESKDTIKKVLDMDGKLYILPSSKGSLYTVDEEEETFSIMRAFGRYPLTIPKGVIEMKINLDNIQRLIADTLISFESETQNVMILDQEGHLIYASNEDMNPELLDFYVGLDTKHKSRFFNTVTQEKEIITSYTSSQTGFTTLLIAPTTYIDGNRVFFFKVSLMIFLTMLTLLTVLSWQVAKSISSPIIRLKEDISRLQLDSLSPDTTYISGGHVNELEMLSSAYNQMQMRLKESLDTVVQTRTLSIHSQIMALQAQMDSHFLYNTLTIISVLAEENDDMQVSDMCIKLTEMLRYISQDYAKQTTFEQELLHTHNYTDLIAVRFGSGIAFHYDTDAHLDHLEVPRLIVQPLVENSVKYSRSPDKQLEIYIHTYIENDFWIAEICDNGNGFSQETLDEINRKIESLNTESEYPQLSINGMGMVNIYLRLRLFYTNQFIFEIKNIPPGCMVRIGGKLNEF